MPTDTRTNSSAENSIVGMIAAHPCDAMALAAHSFRLTYGQLNERSAALAHGLQLLGVGPGVPIGVFANRKPAGVVGALAVLKAGGCLAPLDPANPPERLAFMLRDVGAPFVLAERGIADRLPKGAWKTIPLDDAPLPFSKPPSAPPTPAPNHLACISYISGPMGRPLGVEITHAGLLNLIRWHLRAFQVTAADNASQLAPAGSDTALWETWPYLVAGASLHFPDERTRRSPALLHEWLVEEYITMAYVPPAMARDLIARGWPYTAAMRYLLTNVEGPVAYSRAKLPFPVVNHYGPTEATVVATSGPLTVQGGTGRAIDNARVMILNEKLEPVRDGAVGEVCIGGAGLARGYVNQPELTASKFVPDLFSGNPQARLYRTGDLARRLPDGQIVLAGRRDDQIQLGGYRMQPAEIERALDLYPEVRRSAVVVREDTPGERRLVAYVEPAGNATPSNKELEEWVRERVPGYMAPSAIVILETLPVTSEGQVDREALPAPQQEVEASVREEVEARLAQVIAPLLEVEHIAKDDNLFMVSGQPLLGALVLDRIQQVFGVALPANQLFESPTVAALAAQIERAEMPFRSLN